MPWRASCQHPWTSVAPGPHKEWPFPHRNVSNRSHGQRYTYKDIHCSITSKRGPRGTSKPHNCDGQGTVTWSEVWPIAQKVKADLRVIGWKNPQNLKEEGARLSFESLGVCLLRGRIYTQYCTNIRVGRRGIWKMLTRIGVTIWGYQWEEGFYFAIHNFHTILILFNHGQDITFIVILFKTFHFFIFFLIYYGKQDCPRNLGV